MSRGLLFFCDGRNPKPLLAVALHTLRKCWEGPVHVTLGPNRDEWFEQELLNAGVTVSHIDELSHYPGGAKQRAWMTKPAVHQSSPFDTTVVYDCDHLFLKPFDPELFCLAEHYGIVTCHHKTVETPRSLRIAKYEHEVLGHAPFPFHVNTNGGCVGSVRNSPLLDEWYATIAGMLTHPKLRKLADEFAMGYVMGRHHIPIQSPRWSWTLPTASHTPPEDTMAVHMANRRYRWYPEYKEALNKALEDDWMQLRTRRDYYRKSNSGAFPA